MYCSHILCFFFKQKTAYELRISDWSSDVCSSDLGRLGAGLGCPAEARHVGMRRALRRQQGDRLTFRVDGFLVLHEDEVIEACSAQGDGARDRRSEEHTSELQSLMRISYAVFCLKKKKQDYQRTRT